MCRGVMGETCELNAGVEGSNTALFIMKTLSVKKDNDHTTTP